MIRLIAVAGFALAVATSAQAMTLAPIHQPNGMITQVAFGCGPGRAGQWSMVFAWPELQSAKPAEPSAGGCGGQEALALCTSENAIELASDRSQIGVEGRRCKANPRRPSGSCGA
jgi:hypothetical protein